MQAKFGADVTDLSELDTATYDGIMLWAEAVKKAGSIERDKVTAALESGLSIDSPTGKVTMDGATHHTIRNTYLAEPENRSGRSSRPSRIPSRPTPAAPAISSRLRAPTSSSPGSQGLSAMDLVGLLAFNVLTGIATLILITLGLGVIYGMMRIINLAHGEFMMLGAYTAVMATGAGCEHLDRHAGPAAPRGRADRVDPGAHRHPLPLRADDGHDARHLGISLGLIGLVTTLYGNVVRGVSTPVGSFDIGRYGASLYSLVILVTALSALAAMFLLLRFTKFGLILRATMQNPRMAAALGVQPSRIYMATFALGAALAGLAGGVLAPISGVSPAMGAAYIARAFITVLGGGPAIITGTGLASTLFGSINELVSFKTTPVIGDVALLTAAILLIRVLPQGITGRYLRRSL